jgi:hypothetical protein
MSFYDDRILPHLINLACSAKPTRKQREKMCQTNTQATGKDRASRLR